MTEFMEWNFKWLMTADCHQSGKIRFATVLQIYDMRIELIKHGIVGIPPAGGECTRYMYFVFVYHRIKSYTVKISCLVGKIGITPIQIRG